MRLLLIEDDLKIALFIKTGLKEAGFIVDHTTDGEDGLSMALSESYALAIIDIMLPKLDGFSIIQELRKNEVNTPVIIVSAKRAVDDRVKGLRIGGDDYITKPFAFSELLARVEALIRRAGNVTNPSGLTFADLSINLQTRKAYRAQKEIELQPLEFSLLEYLMRNAGHIVSKTMIMEHVWDYDFNPRTNVVEARICYLREKIDKNFEKKLIHTIRGIGYVIREAE
ncbi:MAG: response regulator transcription factor [Bacteroidia bacterium]|nr:response regulator transcription factor [Bacteroidia bacterium]